jgi:hypothetical protein
MLHLRSGSVTQTNTVYYAWGLGAGGVEGAFIATKCCACAGVMELRLLIYGMGGGEGDGKV